MRVSFNVIAPVIAVAAVAALAACTTTATSSATAGENAWTGQKAAPPGQSRYPLAHKTLSRMKAKDPGIEQFIKNSYGYAVFPTVSEGALIIGGSYGEGGAFHDGKMVANCSIAKGSIGFQIGGKAYSEVIFF